MNREIHVPLREGVGVRFPRATRPAIPTSDLSTHQALYEAFGVPRCGDRSKSWGSALHRRARTVPNGKGSGRDDASRLKGVEP
jgi:hypothetical protein